MIPKPTRAPTEAETFTREPRYLRSRRPGDTLLLALALLAGCSCGPERHDRDASTVDCLARWQNVTGEPLPPNLPIVGSDVIGEYGTLSSPRAHDLDSDTCADFVFGAGVERNTYPGISSDYGRVIAVGGATGEVLWTVRTRGEVFASAVVRSRATGGPLVVVGGREGTLIAIDGATGRLVWEVDPSVFGVRELYFSFFSPQAVEDVNADGVGDFLTVYGGDALVAPGQPRDPSWVALIDGANGAVLARRITPDLAESYTSPVILRTASESPGTGTVFVFGTGGESLPGSLWRGSVSELLAGPTDEHWGTSLYAGTNGKGVIAPSVIADFTGDGELDIGVVAFGGRVALLEGPSFTERWHLDFAGEESSLSGALAHLADGAAFVVTHDTGVFPNYTAATHRSIRASDGMVLRTWSSTLPFACSPLAVDLDHDGVDELLMGSTAAFGPTLSTELRIYDSVADSLRTFEFPFAMGATPLVHVAEGHDTMELVLAGFVNGASPGDPPAWRMRRASLGAERPDAITWGAYLGNCGTGRAPCAQVP